MQVRVYNAAKGGSVLYSENVGRVRVTNGEFYFNYGGAGAGIAAALKGSQHWLAVVVNNVEQSPRLRLVPVPFALRAKESEDAQVLKGQVGTLSTSVLAVQVQSTTLGSNITALQTQNTALTSNVTTLTSNVTTLTSNVTTLQNQIASLTSNATSNGNAAELKQLLISLGVIPDFEPNVIVSTFAGSGNEGFADGIGTSASFYYPRGLVVDSSGNVYVADSYNQRIRKITPDGTVTTLAGSGDQGYADGIGTAASFDTPEGIAVDSTGNLYVADSGNNRIRKITPNGTVTTLAGSGHGYADGIGTAASFNYPRGVVVDSSGNVYVADVNNARIRKITSQGIVSTFAGSGNYGFADGNGTEAKFSFPSAVAVDTSGYVYVADAGNYRIRKITPQGVVSTLAGVSSGNTDGPGMAAGFSDLKGIQVDSDGNVYVSSRDRIRKIRPHGDVSTLAGKGQDGFADGPGPEAVFRDPAGVAVDSSGNVYVADRWNHRIRKITVSK
jgi:sugar lactone lactonase YvrE